MQRKKINWISILQGWAMLWVVVGHSFIGSADHPEMWPLYVRVLYKFAYSFHMALFMFTSGYLFFMTRLADGENKWPYQKVIVDKAKRLLLPGIVFSLLAFILKIAFPAEMSRKVGIGFQDIMHMILYPHDNPLREMWFIVTLFWMFIFTPLWRWSLKDKWKMVATTILLVIVHFIHPHVRFLCIGRFFSFAIWFYWGVLMCCTRVIDEVLQKKSYLFLLAGIIIYAIGFKTIPECKIIGGIILSTGLALIFDRYTPKIFAGFRNYTYQIFLMGIFCQIFVKILYSHISMPYLMAYILCIVAGLYIPVFISKLIEKTNYRPLLYCVGLKPS